MNWALNSEDSEEATDRMMEIIMVGTMTEMMVMEDASWECAIECNRELT